MGPYTDVFRLEVSHLFHTQTPSNWILNLWWRLIIRPSSEVLMKSYFSWLTSPQITSGDSGFWVWISFRASPPLAGGIKMSLWWFAGPASGFRLVKLMANVPNQKSGNRSPHLTPFKVSLSTKKMFHLQAYYFRCSTWVSLQLYYDIVMLWVSSLLPTLAIKYTFWSHLVD